MSSVSISSIINKYIVSVNVSVLIVSRIKKIKK